jgi:hypothetical protein
MPEFFLTSKFPPKKSEAAGATRNVYGSLVFMQLGESGCVMLALSTAIDIYIGGRHVKITHHSVKSRQKLEAF